MNKIRQTVNVQRRTLKLNSDETLSWMLSVGRSALDVFC